MYYYYLSTTHHGGWMTLNMNSIVFYICDFLNPIKVVVVVVVAARPSDIHHDC